MIIDIRKCISEQHINIVKKNRMMRGYEEWSRKIKKLVGIPYKQIPFVPLAPINGAYGDEELLRRYADIQQDLYAIIEHGVFFGNNTDRVGDTGEWELGCILTNGEYRKKLISRVFPDYYCEMIGPMIHYAKRDQDFFQEIRSRQKAGEKTLTFFPAHGLKDIKLVYDIQSTINNIIRMADNYECENILLCAFPHDITEFEKIIKEMNLDNRIIVVTSAGKEGKDFLPRQRAIIELSDFTISNKLGTHLGYCVYLNKPHILLSENYLIEGDPKKIKAEYGKRNKDWKIQYAKEVDMFQEAFSINSQLSDDEKWNLCDYYWGFSKVKTPEEIKGIYQACKTHSISFMKNKLYKKYAN